MNSARNQETSSEGEHQFLFQAVLALKTEDEAKMFFEDLCTPAELQDFSDRWRVVGPLTEGVPYRKIHENTGVSVTTIGRVARSLKYGMGGYDLIYKRISRTRYDKKIKVTNSSTKKRSFK